MSDWPASRSQYWVQYLVMNWQDMCEGIGKLRGRDLSEHLQQVLDVTRHVLLVAIAGSGIAAQYVPAVRTAVQQIGERIEEVLSVAGPVLEMALVAIGAIVRIASTSDRGQRVGDAMQCVGRGIGAVANELVAAIRQVLADIERAIAGGKVGGRLRPSLSWKDTF